MFHFMFNYYNPADFKSMDVFSQCYNKADLNLRYRGVQGVPEKCQFVRREPTSKLTFSETLGSVEQVIGK